MDGEYIGITVDGIGEKHVIIRETPESRMEPWRNIDLTYLRYEGKDSPWPQYLEDYRKNHPDFQRSN